MAIYKALYKKRRQHANVCIIREIDVCSYRMATENRESGARLTTSLFLGAFESILPFACSYAHPNL